MLEKTSIK
jgi:hypothetical protein